jgi:hypothetical protein
MKEITRCCQDINNRLGALPPPIKAPRSCLHNLCIIFERDLKEWIGGEHNKKDLAVRIAEEDKKFLRDVKYSIAKFGLVDRDEEAARITTKCANDFLFQKQGMSIGKNIYL